MRWNYIEQLGHVGGGGNAACFEQEGACLVVFVSSAAIEKRLRLPTYLHAAPSPTRLS